MANILIIDDDEGIIEALSQILEDEGFTVRSYTTGAGILPRIRAFNPDLILLDILISGSDGLDICRMLKKNPATRRIPVVLISAHPAGESMADQAGADGFLAKPFGIDRLLHAVETSIS